MTANSDTYKIRYSFEKSSFNTVQIIYLKTKFQLIMIVF